MTKDLFDKYIWLVDVIYRSRKITFEEINERWLRSSLSDGQDIPLRTFHNWRAAIEQIFDINIECNRKGGYYYYIENVDDLENNGLRNWLLNTFSVNNLLVDRHNLNKRILFEYMPSDKVHLEKILEAMRDGHEARLEYRCYWCEETGCYTFRPYCVKLFKQHWYAVGQCVECGSVRTFALDHIIDMHITDKEFVYPKDFNPEKFFEDSFGIVISDDNPVKIRLKVYGMHASYMRSQPLHHSQQEVETAEGYSVFEYYMRPTCDLIQEILSRGSDVEVVSPESFRKKVAEVIRRMAGRSDGDS